MAGLARFPQIDPITIIVISATETQDLFSNTTDIGFADFVKWPVPSLIYNLSSNASSLAGISLPPAKTNRSGNESPLASKLHQHLRLSQIR